MAEPWKTCAFNDQPIRCRDSHSPDGTVRIVWEDGKAMTYRLVEEGFPVSVLRDSLGGTWERQILVSGQCRVHQPGERQPDLRAAALKRHHPARAAAGADTARSDDTC